MNPFVRRSARKADRFLMRIHHGIERRLDRAAGVVRDHSHTLGRAYNADWEGYECVFVLSTGRTGTQTLSALLDISPFITAEHEPAPRIVKASYDAYQDSNAADWTQKWSQLVKAVRDDHILEATRRGTIYVETNNRFSMLAPAVRRAFPSSRFVFLHRDPIRVIVSSMRRGAYQGGNMAWNFARIHPVPGDEYLERWASMTAVEKEAWRWTRVNESILEFMSTLPESDRFEMRASELFGQDRTEIHRLFEFIGVPVPPEGELDQVLDRRLNAGSHYDQMDFELSGDDRARISPVISQLAERLGYPV